jgi:hypothetical protein
MKTPRILLFGDSHVYAVERAIYHRNYKRRPIPLEAYRQLKAKNGKQLGNLSLDAFHALIKELDPEDLVLSMIGGNQHAVFSLIQHPQPFDFFEPGLNDAVESGLRIIPYRTIEQVFAEGMQKDLKAITTLQKSTAAHVVHIIPPPPKADAGYIRQFHEAVFAEGVATRGVSPASLRLKFWKLQARVLERQCKAAKVDILLPPAATLDDEGFLASKFYANDATHANSAYGEIILTEVERRFLTPAAPEATA